MLAAATPASRSRYAIGRYGKLCQVVPTRQTSPDRSRGHVFSAEDVAPRVGAVVTIPRHRALARTGRYPIGSRECWLEDLSFNPDAQVAHVLAMVAFNEDLSHGAKMHVYDADGSREIQRLGDIAELAIAQDAARLGDDLESFTIQHIFEPLGMEASTWRAFSGAPPQAYGWTRVRDMRRLPIARRGGVGTAGARRDDEGLSLTHRPSKTRTGTAI